MLQVIDSLLYVLMNIKHKNVKLTHNNKTTNSVKSQHKKITLTLFKLQY